MTDVEPNWSNIAKKCIEILPTLGLFERVEESQMDGKEVRSLIFNPSIAYPADMSSARRGRILKESDVINSAVTFGSEGTLIQKLTTWDAAFFTTSDKKRQILLVGLSFMRKE
jgi:hypothetical protein